MKVFVNRKYVDGPWGGGNQFVKNLFEYGKKFGVEVTNRLSDDLDVIHIQDVHADDVGVDYVAAVRYKQEINPKVKIVHRVNDADLGRDVKFREDAYKELSKYTYATIFVSDWTKNYFINKGWYCDNTFVLYNGIDTEIFKPREPLNDGKINIVTHHWSNNYNKGFKIYEKLDRFIKENSDFTFSYIGQHRNSFRNTNIVSPMFGKKLGRELSKYNVYISASEYENCPNHILESLACGIPTYSLSGNRGAASAGLVGKDFVYDDWDNLKKILLTKKFNNNHEHKISSWEGIMRKYFKIYKGDV